MTLCRVILKRKGLEIKISIYLFIYLSIYNEILLELTIRWEKIRNRLILSVMLGKLLWVGGTLDDMVAGPKLRENNRP